MPPRINIPPVTRILLITLGLQSVLSAIIRYKQWTADNEIVIPYLTLVPQLSLIYPWTFLTTTLVESNVFTLAIAVLTLYNGGRYLERAWSSREFAKFLLITALVPNTLCFATMIVFFTFTRNESWTLTTIAGTIPLQISFLVAFSQLVPAHTVTLFRGILSLRVPRFPLVYLGLVFLLSLTPLLTAASFLLAAFGLLTSWTYLRFYKTVFPDLDTSQSPYHHSSSSSSSSSPLRGDASETFAFSEFFPGPAKPLVAAVGNQIFNILVSLRLCTPFSQADASAHNQHHGGGHGHGHNHRGAAAPGSARAEAERRRALALKALDQRLHAATAGRGGGAAAATASMAGRAVSPAPPAPSSPSAASSSMAAAPTATGPTVSQQPLSNNQTAMTSRPSDGMLGETSFDPDHDDGGGDKGEP